MKKFVISMSVIGLALVSIALWSGLREVHSEEPPYEPYVGADADAYYYDIIEPDEIDPLYLIGIAEEALVDSFARIHEVDYSQIHEGYVDLVDSDVNLIFWSNVPLRDVSLISLRPDTIGDELIFIPLNSYGLVEELPPGEAYVVRSYFGAGTLPWSGLQFIDENGLQRYFTIQACGETGSFLLFEFQDRRDELPSDWTAWWENDGYEPVADMPVDLSQIRQTAIDPSRPMIALTFDDGPHEFTQSIIDTLYKHQARATFFVIGDRVSAWQNMIRVTHQQGNEILGHSWAHDDLTTLTQEEVRQDITKTHNAIEQIIGTTPRMLRVPMARFNDTVVEAARHMGFALVQWNLDPRDWESRNADIITEYILDEVEDGQIIVLHDIHESTAIAMQTVIPTLINRGYQLVTVSELLELNDVIVNPGDIIRSSTEFVE